MGLANGWPTSTASLAGPALAVAQALHTLKLGCYCIGSDALTVAATTPTGSFSLTIPVAAGDAVSVSTVTG